MAASTQQPSLAPSGPRVACAVCLRPWLGARRCTRSRSPAVRNHASHSRPSLLSRFPLSCFPLGRFPLSRFPLSRFLLGSFASAAGSARPLGKRTRAHGIHHNTHDAFTVDTRRCHRGCARRSAARGETKAGALFSRVLGQLVECVNLDLSDCLLGEWRECNVVCCTQCVMVQSSASASTLRTAGPAGGHGRAGARKASSFRQGGGGVSALRCRRRRGGSNRRLALLREVQGATRATRMYSAHTTAAE